MCTYFLLRTENKTISLPEQNNYIIHKSFNKQKPSRIRSTLITSNSGASGHLPLPGPVCYDVTKPVFKQLQKKKIMQSNKILQWVGVGGVGWSRWCGVEWSGLNPSLVITPPMCG